MAVTLPAGLNTAQDNVSRKPIINLIVGQRVEDIPFDGSFLTTSTDEETEPVTLELADGRIAVCYIYYTDVNNRGLKFYITNTDLTAFTTTFTINLQKDILGATFEQLDNGNIGIVYLESFILKTIKYRVITTTGTLVSTATIASFLPEISFSHMWVRKTASNFLLVYARNISYDLPTSGGTYTGTTNSQFTIEVTTGGTQTTGYFRWRKDLGSWNGPTLMTGAAQALSDGVTVTFVAGNYYQGQIFKINVTKAIKATGSITISSIPDDGDQVTLGATTYTFKSALVAGGNPNEVVIDVLSQEITLQNLLCAITDTTFEGTGEGVRYGNGTTANASATGIRVTVQLLLEALTAGTAGNSITLTVDTDHFSNVAFSGGANSSIGALTGGDIYEMIKRTSTNFTSWSAEAQISLGSLLPSRLKDSPSLTRLNNDDIVLFFDYADDVNDSLDNLTNGYYMTSTDDGATWDTPTALTTSSLFSEVFTHPVGVLRDSGELYAIFTRAISSLRMDNTALNWPDGVYTDWAHELSWDSSNRKLYVTNMYTYTGTKRVQCIVKVDIDSWSVDQFWDRTTTTPRLSNTVGSLYGRFIGDGYLVPVFDQDSYVIDVLDGESDTITSYIFKDNVAEGYVKNVEWTLYQNASIIRTAQIDAASNRMYVFFMNYTSPSTPNIQIGYIDLTEGSPYTFNVIVEESGTVALGWINECEMRVYPDIDRIFISGVYTLFGGGGLRIYSLSGAVIDDYRNSNDTQFPKWGMRNLCYYDGNLYGSFQYESLYDQSERRGLLKVNLSTRNCSYHRPTWETLNDYQFTSIELGATNQLVITSFDYGVTVYSIPSDTWVLYNNVNIPNMIPDADYSFRCSSYDSSTGSIMAGFHGVSESYAGIVMFSTFGNIIKSYYQIGTYNVDHWDWGSQSNIVQGSGDFDCVGTIDADDNMWCFWQSDDRVPTADAAIKWDLDGSDVDLNDYLVTERDVTVRRSIDGTPNTLEFSCSHGHLFDPFNTQSVLRNTFKKGRKITLQFGETISGTPVLQNMGEFYVVSAKTSYRRGTYSTLSVKCEDDRTFWTDKKILVTTAYDTTPQQIITSLLTTYAGIAPGNISMPTMSADNLSHQFVDETLEDVINKICNRYGYFFTIDVDGTYTARKIDDGNSIDHTYSDSSKILSFTPDNTSSNNINRVRVIGQDRTGYELSTEEELVAGLDGTVGWWGGTKEHTVYYSEDGERRAKNVRLEVVETLLSIGFALSGEITEELTYEDPEGKYCIVTITSPNLTLELIAALALLVAAYFIGDPVILSYTVPLGSFLKALACWLALNILGATGNYIYEIYGFPYGEVTYSLEGVANDTVHQTETGYIVEQQVNDDLCYSTAACVTVAEFELMIIMLQRNTLDVEKITHLQDEEGDTIVFPHPYTGDNVKIFVTEFTRRFKKSRSEGEEGDGYFYDSIDGWVIV